MVKTLQIHGSTYLYYYKILNEFYSQNKIGVLAFCKNNAITPGSFHSYRTCITAHKTDPKIEFYREQYEIYKKCDQSAREFCLSNEVDLNKFKFFIRHFSVHEFFQKKGMLEDLDVLYDKIIAYNTNEYGSPTRYGKERISFHKVNKEEKEINIVSDIEENKSLIICEENNIINQLELIIKKGIKVTVDGNVSTDKLVKIIDFLRGI